MPHAASVGVAAIPPSGHPSAPSNLETLGWIVKDVRDGDREQPLRKLILDVIQHIERNWVGNNVAESTAPLLWEFWNSPHHQREMDSLQAWTEFKNTDCCKALGESTVRKIRIPHRDYICVQIWQYIASRIE